MIIGTLLFVTHPDAEIDATLAPICKGRQVTIVPASGGKGTGH